MIDGYVTYYRFDTADNLNASYQSNLDFFGEEATGSSCETEASEGGYAIQGTPAGRLMCAPYDPGNPDGSIGMIAFWTHEAYLIGAGMVLYEQDYPQFWAHWQVAGPDPSDLGPAPTQSSTDWTDTAELLRGQNGEQFNFDCPPAGTPSAVYGTDTYTDDSSVCTSAVHAGVITLEAGGPTTIEIRPGLDAYSSSTRNGITSNSWGSWSGSFVFVSP